MQFGADFTALIDRFSSEPDRRIALAVSGGSDSLALLSLCHTWAGKQDRRLIVFTVDHGLRPEAQDEAKRVAALCDRLQVPHQILHWTNPKPSQNAARRARYDLIAEAMAQVGARCLLTGHTLDDVIENVFIRRRRGVRGALSVGPGLAAPMPTWPAGQNLTVLHPLVGARRSGLRAYLDRLGVSWIDDPSNQNMKFERVRIRAFFERHPNLQDGIVSAVTALQRQRAELDLAIGQSLAQVTVLPDGLIVTSDQGDLVRLLGLLARMASGGDRDPRRSAVIALISSLAQPGARQTLGGAWFQRTRTGFLVGRDPAEPILDSEASLFDGRYARDPNARFLDRNETSFLVRHALPPDAGWRESISTRVAHLRLCFGTPHQSTGVE
ncbi:MAG: tRNA lysidine(34) synthetase TilS [Pseudomonadota bacterium]